jgi:aspartyl-tRNA(Asn)/glutamyl-tRNA(Gln) amidotransferase subunit B
MRSKEDAMDYRYFTEPDLPPLVLQESFINELKEKILQSPAEKIEKYKKW